MFIFVIQTFWLFIDELAGKGLDILIIGKFKILDNLIKIIGIVLLLSTLTAFVLCLFHGPINKSIGIISEQSLSRDAWFFLIPLMGWMPTAVDLSSWNSLWTVEK